MARENFPEGNYFHKGNAVEPAQSVVCLGKLFPVRSDSAEARWFAKSRKPRGPIDSHSAACYVVGLRWGYFTRSVPSRQWGRYSQYGPDQNCHPGCAPAQPEKHQPRNSAQHADCDRRALRLGEIVARL